MKDRDDIQELKDSWREEFGSAVLKDAAKQPTISGSDLETLRRIPQEVYANEQERINHWPWMALAASLLFLAFWILRPGQTAWDAAIDWTVLEEVDTDLIDRELEQLELEEWAALGMAYAPDHELNLIEEETLEDWLGEQTELLNYIQ
jgi:hypothetical protein